MVATYIKKDYTKYDWYDSGVCSREIINIFSGLVENFNTGTYSDTIHVINTKLCMMVPLTELYLFIPLLVTMTIFEGHCNVEQF